MSSYPKISHLLFQKEEKEVFNYISCGPAPCILSSSINKPEDHSALLASKIETETVLHTVLNRCNSFADKSYIYAFKLLKLILLQTLILMFCKIKYIQYQILATTAGHEI